MPKKRINISTPLKCLGICLIIHYLYAHPPIQFNAWGILLYWIILQLSYILSSFEFATDDEESAASEIKKSTARSESEELGTGKECSVKSASDIQSDEPTTYTRHFVKKPWHLLLVAGEDGIFLLPLLYLGINYVSAAVVGVLFGWIHFPNYREVRPCVGVGLGYFLIALFVLPMGILTVAVAHIVYHLINFAIIQYKVSCGHTTFTHTINFGSRTKKNANKNNRF